MGSFLQATFRKEKKLPSENAGLISSPSSHSDSVPAFSPNSPTGSENGSSLDKIPKKVGQFPASRCENPRGAYFICEHGHPVYRTLSCHARFAVDCPHCARRWRRKTIKNFERRVKKMKYPAFVTLTLKKGGMHVLKELNGLSHRCRKYVRRKKKDQNRCKNCGNCKKSDKDRCMVCGKNHRTKPNQKCCNKCSNTFDIRGSVSCIEPPNHVHAIWDCDYIPQKELSATWKLVTGDSFVVDIRKVEIRKVEKHRWRGAVNDLVTYLSKLSYYVSKISRGGSCVDLSGVHVVNSWGDGGYYKKVCMVCKICGSYFEPLWYCGQVDDYVNDSVDFVKMDNDYG